MFSRYLHTFRTGCYRCGGALTYDHVCPMSYWTDEEWAAYKKKQEEFTANLKKSIEGQNENL